MGRWIVLSLWLLLAPFLDAAPQPAAGGGPRLSDSVVKATAAAEKPVNGKQTATITLEVDRGWHIYANPVGNADQESGRTSVAITANVKPKGVKVTYPKGKLIRDPQVGDYNVYEGKVEIKAVVERAASDNSPLEVTIKVQACNQSKCLQPATIKLRVP